MYFVPSRHKPAAGAVGAFVPQAPGSRRAGARVWALLQFGSEPWCVWPEQMSTEGGTEAPGSTFPWNTQLAGLRFVTAVQPSDLQLPGSTEIATEGWRGKG